MNTNVIP